MSVNTKKRNILLHGLIDAKLLDGLKFDGETYILEGRPTLESAKYLSAYLLKRKIKPILTADNMAGFLCAHKKIHEIAVAFEQIEEKNMLSPIGGLILAVLGKKHNITVNGYRGKASRRLMGGQKDLTHFNNNRIASLGVKGYIPLVENVPLKYIGKCYE